MLKNFLQKDNIWLGLGLAILTPIILYFILQFSIDFLSVKFSYGIPLVSVLNIQLISAFLNLFIFKSYLIKKEYEMTGRGVVIATFIYVLIHFYIRWGIMN